MKRVLQDIRWRLTLRHLLIATAVIGAACAVIHYLGAELGLAVIVSGVLAIDILSLVRNPRQLLSASPERLTMLVVQYGVMVGCIWACLESWARLR